MTAVRPISEDDLQAFVDDALDGARRAEVGAYLEANPEAAKRVEGFVAQRRDLRDAFAGVIREPLPPELDLGRLIAARRRRTSPAWRSIAAGLALVIVGAGAGWGLRGVLEPAPNGLGALAEQASYSFQTFAPDRGRPVEIKAEESAALVKWVSNRLKRPVAPPDLGASGYRFMGGRVVPTPQGPAGLFMYDDDRGSRLVMLMRPMDRQADEPMSEHAEGDRSNVVWARDGMGYSLVGQGAPAILRPIADEIRRQTNL